MWKVGNNFETQEIQVSRQGRSGGVRTYEGTEVDPFERRNGHPESPVDRDWVLCSTRSTDDVVFTISESREWVLTVQKTVVGILTPTYRTTNVHPILESGKCREL